MRPEEKQTNRDQKIGQNEFEKALDKRKKVR